MYFIVISDCIDTVYEPQLYFWTCGSLSYDITLLDKDKDKHKRSHLWNKYFSMKNSASVGRIHRLRKIRNNQIVRKLGHCPSTTYIMKTVEKEVAISEEQCLIIIKVHLILNCKTQIYIKKRKQKSVKEVVINKE